MPKAGKSQIERDTKTHARRSPTLNERVLNMKIKLSTKKLGYSN